MGNPKKIFHDPSLERRSRKSIAITKITIWVVCGLILIIVGGVAFMVTYYFFSAEKSARFKGAYIEYAVSLYAPQLAGGFNEKVRLLMIDVTEENCTVSLTSSGTISTIIYPRSKIFDEDEMISPVFDIDGDMIYLGYETLSTVFGSRRLSHYQSMDQSTDVYLQRETNMVFIYHSKGRIISTRMEISDTNIDWLKRQNI